MAKRSRTKRGKRAKRPQWQQRLITFGKALGVGALVFALVGALGLIYLFQTTELPNANEKFQTQTTFIYYNDGKSKLGSLRVQNRQSIPYDQMPQTIKDAVVAAENRTFWTDPGISARGIARAAFTIARGGEMQGGSTITQQYIKVLYLNSERTLSRKLRELMLAIKVGKQIDKEEILEGYLNTIYFGRGAYGIQAASRAYFLTDAKNLTVPQAAVLASVLNAPNALDPSHGKKAQEKLLKRYRYVLDGLLEMEKITASEHQKFSAALPEFPKVPHIQTYQGPSGFLMKMVEKELAEIGFSEAQIDGGGLKVVTTFDAKAQQAAVQVAQKYTKEVAAQAKGKPDPNQLHIALASVNAQNGEVLALYGGPDYVKNQRNWATTKRPAASTFKVWALVAGLRNGISLNHTFNGNSFTPDGDQKPVRNQGHRQFGTVTLRKATESSVNTAYVDMVQQLDRGPAKVIKAANDAGIETGPGWDENNRISLGTAEVSPLENALGFATLANEGRQVTPHVVKKVVDAQGNVVYKADPKSTQTIEPEVAIEATDALRSVVKNGSGKRAQALGRVSGGKTGTSGVGDAVTASWYVGFTKQISTAVMYVAGDSGNEDLDPYRRPGDSGFLSSVFPAMTWLDFMKVATEGQEKLEFAKPTGLNKPTERPTPPPPTVTSTPSEPSPTPTVSEAPTTPATPTQTPSVEPEATPTTETPKPTKTKTKEKPTKTAKPTPTKTADDD